MTIKNISISKDFSRVPAGRFYSDGPFSGQRFREEFLLPALKNKDISKVIVNLDNLCGVGSSFWDEAFTQLIIREKIPYQELLDKLEFVCTDDDTLIPLLTSYLKEANNV